MAAASVAALNMDQSNSNSAGGGADSLMPLVTPLYWQMKYLVSNLNKKNFKANVAEINQLIDLYGGDARVFLLVLLTTEIDFRDVKSSHSQKDLLKIQLLSSEIALASTRPNFTGVICEVMNQATAEFKSRDNDTVVTQEFLEQFSKVLKLSLEQQISIGLALAQSGREYDAEAIPYLQMRVTELANSSGKLQVDVLHALLAFIQVDDRLNDSRELMIDVIVASHSELMGRCEFEGITKSKVHELDGAKVFSNVVDCAEADAEDLECLLSDCFAQCSAAEVMEDAGYDCSVNAKDLLAFLSEFGLQKPDAAGVAAILTMIARTHSTLESPSQTKTWNVDVIADALKPVMLSLDWTEVAVALDRKDLKLLDSKDYSVLITAFMKFSGKTFPISCLFREWEFKGAHVDLIREAIHGPSELIDFAASPNMLNTSDSGMDLSNVPSSSAWISMDLVATLVDLCDSVAGTRAINLLKIARDNCPSVLVSCLCQIEPRWSNVPLDFFVNSFQNVINAGAFSLKLLEFLWAKNAEWVTIACVRILQKCSKEELSPVMLRLFALVKCSSDIFSMILRSKEYNFALRLAIVGSNHDSMDIEGWLKERLTNLDLNFVSATITFLKNNFASALPKCNISPETSANLSVESLMVFLKCLLSNSTKYPAELSRRLQVLLESCSKAHPYVASLGLQSPKQPNPEAESGESLGVQKPKEQAPVVARDTYNSIFKGESAISKVIAVLKRYKNSTLSFEKEVYVQVVSKLLEEYVTLDKRSDVEVECIGKTFGSLVAQDGFTPTGLNVAFSRIAEAITKPPNVATFKFVGYALKQIPDRAVLYPNFFGRNDIKQLVDRTLVEFDRIVGNSSQGRPVTVSPSGNGEVGSRASVTGRNSEAPMSTVSSNRSNQGVEQKAIPSMSGASTIPGFGNVAPSLERVNGTVRLKLPVDHAFGEWSIVPKSVPDPPPQHVQDRLHFIINNMTISNLESKLNEIRDCMVDSYYYWLADYLVSKRLSRQQNYHPVFDIMVDKLGSKDLNFEILRKTIQMARTLLESPTITSNSQERGYLKNLGSWLGIFTLAKNKPLLQREIDLKELLYLGYETGHLIAVTSFIAKILDGCKKSKIFKPPNPWIMGLLNAMREIYDVPDLKLNLKFEIEVVCKAFNITLSDLKKEGYLPQRRAPSRNNNPDLNTNKGAASSPALTARSENESHSNPSPTAASGPSGVIQFPAGFQEGTVIPNLAAYVSISPSLELFKSYPDLKRAVPVAVDRAIREIIQPVVERSVTIACITSRELIVKDFAIEGDEAKMRKSAHLMVSNLAGSLALVTCKEPLRVSIGNHLRTILNLANVGQSDIDHVMQVCSSENLELGCMLIEKAATEKAMRDIDESLSTAYAARRRHRESGVQQQFFDLNVLSSGNRYPAALPEPFRPKPGGLQPQQLLVYEAYQRLPRQPVVPPARSSFSSGSSPSTGKPTTPVSQSASGDSSTSVSKAMIKLSAIITTYERVVKATVRQATSRDLLRMSSLSQDNEAIAQVREIKSSLLGDVPASHHVDVCIAAGHRMFKRMYELSEPGDELLLELLLVSLESLVSPYPAVKKELPTWIIRAPVEDKLKLHGDIINFLIRAKMLKLGDLDQYLARNMDKSFTAIEFAVFIIRYCLTLQHVTVATEVPSTIEALERLVQRAGNTQHHQQVAPIAQVIEGIRRNFKERQQQSSESGKASSTSAPAPSSGLKSPQGTPDQIAFRHTVSQVLERWIPVSPKASTDKIFVQFINLLKKAGIMKDEETFSSFFKVATELCIDSCLKTSYSGKTNGKVALNYTVIDAYAKLVVMLVKYADSSSTVKLSILTKALNGVTAVLGRVVEAHRKGTISFDQRVFFRLYVCLISDLSTAEAPLEQVHMSILRQFAQSLHSIQPRIVPEFTASWMELISHRTFLPRLMANKQAGWAMMIQLLMDIFIFLEPYMRTVTMTTSLRVVYKGLLRIMLIFLHDYAEFLVQYQSNLCNVLPPTCVQLRNIALSAFPRSMHLPDPLTPGLQISSIPEIKQTPFYPDSIFLPLNHNNLQEETKSFLTGAVQSSNFLRDLPSKLLIDSPSAAAASRYSVPTINSLVVYLGSHAVAQLQSSKGMVDPRSAMDSTVVKVLLHLCQELDSEGRFYLLTAIVNQLRYPNSHTHYFSCVVLYIFTTSKSEAVKEQITRVIIERLIAHRPHPWGLLVTFIELVRNKSYNFWGQSFLEHHAELKVVFDDVARSCLGPSKSPATAN